MTDTKEQLLSRKRRPVTLPSGAEVIVSLPNVSVMLRAGRIPNPLVGLAIKLDASVVRTDELKELEQFVEWTDLCRLLIAAMFVEPTIEADDLDQLAAEDYDQLYRWALRMDPLPKVGDSAGIGNGAPETIGDLAPFRPEPAGG